MCPDDDDDEEEIELTELDLSIVGILALLFPDDDDVSGRRSFGMSSLRFVVTALPLKLNALNMEYFCPCALLAASVTISPSPGESDEMLSTKLSLDPFANPVAGLFGMLCIWVAYRVVSSYLILGNHLTVIAHAVKAEFWLYTLTARRPEALAHGCRSLNPPHAEG